MLELMDWIGRRPFEDKPWLILGKGPTFTRRHEFDLSKYNLVSLNHAVRELRVQWAHMIDVDVAAACADTLLDRAEYLVMPLHPHVHFRPTEKRLDEFVREVPILAEFERRGRLVWYNLRTWKDTAAPSPVIHARFFSSEAAVDILGAMGVKQVCSLGVDGGRGYSQAFRDLEGQTMLANGHETFDMQFREIDALVAKHGMSYAPLLEPLRVFVGADEPHLLATRVLDHSIRKHCSKPVVLTPLYNLSHPMPRDERNRPRTPFSFYRFMIPQLRGYRGKALYLDPHMLVFGDIAELWEYPFDAHAVLCTRQAECEEWTRPDWHSRTRNGGVLLLDCSRLDWEIGDIVRRMDEGTLDYAGLMSALAITPSEAVADKLPAEWNSVERFEGGRTKAVNFNVAAAKPWRSDTNPLCPLWEEAFREAVADGIVSDELIASGIQKRFFKPGLAAVAREPQHGAGC